jgi:hypothetical protein
MLPSRNLSRSTSGGIAAMQISRTQRAALGLVLSLAGMMLSAVHADERESAASNVLFTPPLNYANSLTCVVSNVGRSPVTVDVELHDIDGAVALSEHCVMPPGATNFGMRQCAAVCGAPAFGGGYCAFRVLQENKDNLRAAIQSDRYDPVLSTSVPVSALSAQ